MYFSPKHTKCMCTPSAAQCTPSAAHKHALHHCHSLSEIYGNISFLPHTASSCQPSTSECMQMYACNMFMSLLQHVFLVPRSRKQLNPHHHYLHHTPPSFPMGLSTQINWKKEKCNVVLPLHLSGRESRRGCTHGPNGGTISLHLSQTVSSLMGWNIAHKHIHLYHRRVLAYSVSSLYQFPEAGASYLRLPPSHQPTPSLSLGKLCF